MLLTEQSKSEPKLEKNLPKKFRLRKLRRKTIKKKERKKKKQFNQAFFNLRNRLPSEGLFGETKYENDPKVSSLRSAITYITCLKKLLEDCDAGKVGEEVYRKSYLLDNREKRKVEEDKRIEENKTRPKRNISKVKKIVDFSDDFLGQKLILPDPRINYYFLNSVIHTNNALTYTTSPTIPSSPKNVSNLDEIKTCFDHTGSVTYFYSDF